MEVRPRHPPASAHGANALPRSHHLSLSNIRSAQVEVGSNQPTPMIEVDGPARQVEIRHQRHDPPAGSNDRLSHSTGKVGPEVAALHFAVEDARGPERAGYATGPRQPKGTGPEPGSRLRATGNLAALRISDWIRAAAALSGLTKPGATFSTSLG